MTNPQADMMLSQWSLCGDSRLSLSGAAVSGHPRPQHHQELLEELLGTGWDLPQALGELRDISQEHIKVILETSRKDGLYVKGTKRVSRKHILWVPLKKNYKQLRFMVL